MQSSFWINCQYQPVGQLSQASQAQESNNHRELITTIMMEFTQTDNHQIGRPHFLIRQFRISCQPLSQESYQDASKQTSSTTKSKKRKPLFESQRVLEGASNEKVFICATDNEPSASNAQTVQLPADQEENESNAVTPHLKNDVLKFGVLPKTFDFKDGSNGRKENDDPLPGNSDLVEEKDESPSKTIKRARGTWYQHPEEKNMLIPPTPKTDNIFHVFQKKYKDKMQPSVDK
ncbi:hypothetical protein KUCAC02_021301 [Chaenocephalus aceratus]|uniref:Uncharacterized protein n=1 Tax=Chaenocephalus aceratus TaxID=36190 RepID=A0ACB9XGC5_CHAAC|nr:hypothetical protein KUCAC02_021301 [Chaenocephalus aceratus]